MPVAVVVREVRLDDGGSANFRCDDQRYLTLAHHHRQGVLLVTERYYVTVSVNPE